MRSQMVVRLLARALPWFIGVAGSRADGDPAIFTPTLEARRSTAARTSDGARSQVLWTPVLPPLPEGTTHLSFGQLMVTPVGPAGLELSPAAQRLLGKPVRMVGHMVRQMQPTPWTFLLSPVPQSLHEREYFLCDDLPPNTVRVYLPKGPQPIMPYHPGLVAVAGTLTNEGPEESDGRSSIARLHVGTGDTNGLVFITAYTRNDRTNGPSAEHFPAPNGRAPETSNTPNP